MCNAQGLHMNKFVKHAGIILFTIFAVPIIIAAPFLLYGFIGRP
jgi:hypothetical protein